MTQSDDQHLPPAKAFAHHVIHMPRWHKGLLTLATLLLGLGAVGQVVTAMRPSPPPVTLEKQDSSAAPGQSHLLNSSNDNGPTNAPAAEPNPQPSLRERVSPWLTHVGLSVLVGFVLGWVFRAFIKMMSLIALAIISVMAALS